MRVDLTRFPVDWMLESRRFEEAVVRGCVWVLIPLEYFVLTRLPGGGGANDLAFAATAVVCVAIVLAFSAVIAIYPRAASTYEERLRRLALAMIVTWGVTLVLGSLWYFIRHFIWDFIRRFIGLHRDETPDAVAGPISAGFHWLWLNFVFVIIAIALVMVVSLGWRMRYATPHSNACNPNIFVVAGVNAVLMALVHGGAHHILRPRLAFLGTTIKGDASVIGAVVWGDALGVGVRNDPLAIRAQLTFLGTAVKDAAVMIGPPLSVSGADVRRALFVIRPPTVSGMAVERAGSVIMPAFSGADVRALTASGAAP